MVFPHVCIFILFCLIGRCCSDSESDEDDCDAISSGVVNLVTPMKSDNQENVPNSRCVGV